MKPPTSATRSFLKRRANRAARRARRAHLRAGREDRLGEPVRVEHLDEDKFRCWALTARRPT